MGCPDCAYILYIGYTWFILGMHDPCKVYIHSLQFSLVVFILCSERALALYIIGISLGGREICSRND